MFSTLLTLKSWHLCVSKCWWKVINEFNRARFCGKTRKINMSNDAMWENREETARKWPLNEADFGHWYLKLQWLAVAYSENTKIDREDEKQIDLQCMQEFDNWGISLCWFFNCSLHDLCSFCRVKEFVTSCGLSEKRVCREREAVFGGKVGHVGLFTKFFMASSVFTKIFFVSLSLAKLFMLRRLLECLSKVEVIFEDQANLKRFLMLPKQGYLFMRWMLQ